MHRIDTPNRVLDKFGPGKDGFGDGVPATGTSSTKLNAAAFDNYQEEIANAIELSGIPLNPNDMTQLWQAMRATAIANNPDLTAYVLKSGDSMNGPLSVFTNGDFSPNPAQAIEILANSEAVLAFHRSGINAVKIGLDALNRFTIGGWSWPAGTLVLDMGGNLTIPGNATAGQGIFSNAMFPAYAVTQDFVLNADGTYNNLMFASVGGYYWRYQRAIGLLEWVGNNAVGFSIDFAGNVTATGNVNAVGQVSGGTVVGGSITSLGRILANADIVSLGPIFVSFGGAQDFLLSHNSITDGRGIQFSGGGPGPYSFEYQAGIYRWFGNPGGAAQQVMELNAITGALTTIGPMTPGPSDERLKKNIAPYVRGLDDIIRLEAKSFEFTGENWTRNDGQIHYGVTAQQARPIVPECVVALDEITGRDGEVVREAGVLAFDYVPLVYAYLNCFKEIAARLAAVESAIAAKGATS
jgi:hypothetical protein